MSNHPGRCIDRAQLVHGLVAGDETAWREFVEQYGRLAYAAASRLGMTAEQSEDLFQDTCLLALESIQTLRDPGRLASWTYSIAYRRAIDALRRQRPGVALEEVDADADAPPALVHAPEIAAELERLEETASLMDAMAQLDSRCRRLLEALYLETPRMGYNQLAQREGMPIGSIGPNRARCLGKLRSLLRGLSNPLLRPSTGGKQDKGRG